METPQNDATNPSYCYSCIGVHMYDTLNVCSGFMDG